MRSNLTTLDVCSYFNVSSGEVKKWRDEGLKCTELTTGYVYKYNDLVEFLS